MRQPPTKETAVTSSSKAKYRVGVIGCGQAGATRARAFDLHPLCAVAAIADTDADNLALGCERFGNGEAVDAVAAGDEGHLACQIK